MPTNTTQMRLWWNVHLIDPNCASPTFDGHTYDVVQIGGQCWFSENLQTTVYANGDATGELD